MNLIQAIVATVAYHDIFNYPLTSKEILNYLINKKTNKKALSLALKKTVQENKLQEINGYYYLYKKRKIVDLRKARTKYSLHKLKKAKIYAQILKSIPTIQFVGISGALSMGNSTKFDDIDFVIISRKNLLWTTRLMANALLYPVKRKPHSIKISDRACLNLFLDEADLRIKDENIYTAHEICQLRPLWQRNNAYYSFINANSWVKNYLPNWSPEVDPPEGGQALSSNPLRKRSEANNQQLVSTAGGSTINNQKSRGVSKHSQITSRFSLLEILLKKLQLFYMKGKISREKIGDTQIFFHPANTQEFVLKEYQKRIKQLNCGF